MDYNNLFNHILSFVIILYGQPSFPRKIVDMVFNFLINFICKHFCSSLENSIIDIVNTSTSRSEIKVKIRECFKLHVNIFDNFHTEKKRFGFLQGKGYIEPKTFKVRNTFSVIIKMNETVFVETPVVAYYIPLKHTLTYFLNIPHLAKQLINHVEKLRSENDIVSNIIQAKFWKNSIVIRINNEYVLPLFIYFDDIESGNPLGSHSGKNKFGLLYSSIACLPPHMASLLDCILFTMIIRFEDMKQCSNASIFKEIIEQLNELRETGILVEIDNVVFTFKFQTVLITGDNLGLNSICGMVESFRAIHFCRICTADSYQCSTLTTEDKSLLRTRESYKEELLKANTVETSLKEGCVFNQLNGFHIVTLLFHDILEGVCIYVIRSVLYELIFVSKLFTLEFLNLRIQEFNLQSDDTNKPPPITLNRFKEKLNLKYSASEMLFLTRYLGVIIGDKVPHDNEHWQLYIYLRKIVDILMSPRTTIEFIKGLSQLIKQLNTTYIHFYNALKPKFHFLTHYPSIIYSFGPCIHYWAMRYESRHRDIKANAVATNSHKNLLKTIAQKQALQLCRTYEIFEKQSNIVFESNDNVDYNKVRINGSDFKIGSFIVLSLKEPEVKFGKILNIKKIDFTNEEASVEFFVKVFEEVFFDDHVMAYVISETDECKTVSLNNIPSMPTVTFLPKDDTLYIIPKYIL
ncbi:hypothetical protein TKK_0000289 [Trichogramma kaykai]|uniref:Uncharacterized protein n=1 Tax=Trichogramma kaykai TaxID=54128 RepID=A0ABD2W6N9_9HYME